MSKSIVKPTGFYRKYVSFVPYNNIFSGCPAGFVLCLGNSFRIVFHAYFYGRMAYERRGGYVARLFSGRNPGRPWGFGFCYGRDRTDARFQEIA